MTIKIQKKEFQQGSFPGYFSFFRGVCPAVM